MANSRSRIREARIRPFSLDSLEFVFGRKAGTFVIFRNELRPVSGVDIDKLSDDDNPVFAIELFEEGKLNFENLTQEAASFWEGNSNLIKSVLVFDLGGGPVCVYSKGEEGASPPSWVQKDFAICCKHYDAARRRDSLEQ